MDLDSMNQQQHLPAAHLTRRREPQPPSQNIIEAAKAPGADPCDVAAEAMPGYLIGELTKPEADWLLNHTAPCSYCNNLLHGCEQMSGALDDLCTACGAPPKPTAACLGLREARYGYMDTPVGPVLIAVSDRGVCEISYLGHHSADAALCEIEERGLYPVEKQLAIAPVIEQLYEYFLGKRFTFTVPVDFGQMTPFTRLVLETTEQVPFGHVLTYGQIAQQIGQPGASRAVGNALGRNPIPVIVPCHRVVRSDGTMGWYTGGPQIKETLLRIEGVNFSHGEQLPLLTSPN
jgi:methylated-DNA-[protein]-cysteine S-methyltransferase